MALQPKLLRVLQEREIRRLGESQPLAVDVHIIAATAKIFSRRWLNLLEKTMVLCRAETINENDLVLHDHPQELVDPSDLSLKKAMAEIEKDYIKKALAVTGGNRTRAAKILEISLRSLIYKIKDYGL